jgi:lysophospholipase L1-like esterase
MTLRQAAFRAVAATVVVPAAAVAAVDDAPEGRAATQSRGNGSQSWPELIGRDGVHPTDAGHSYMAQRIAPLIYGQLTIRI